MKLTEKTRGERNATERRDHGEGLGQEDSGEVTTAVEWYCRLTVAKLTTREG
jgi:hypothetical protein